MTSATAAVVDEQCYSARTFIRRASFTFARARSAYPTRNDGSRRGMDRRAGEGRAKRRHCARHGEHRPGARGPRDRRDVWDRKTPRFRPCRVSAASIGRAGWTDDRATRAVPALGANSTDRARPSNLAGWTSPGEDNHPRVARRPTLGTSRRLEIRRVVGSTCAARRDRLLRSLAKPPPNAGRTRDRRVIFLEESTRTSPRASRRVARRTFPARPRAPPRTPCQTSHVVAVPSVCLLVFFVFGSIDRADPRAAAGDFRVFGDPRSPSQTFFFFFARRVGSLRAPRAPTLHPRDAHRPFPLRSLSSGPPR